MGEMQLKDKKSLVAFIESFSSIIIEILIDTIGERIGIFLVS